MNDNRYNYGHPYAAWGPMWPFVAPWMQAMQAWACAMSAFVPGPAPRPWDPYTTCAAPGPATAPRVSVTVASQSRAQVSICVDPGADGVALKADPLSAGDDAVKLPLTGVDIKAECGHVRVAVTVPHGQPAGRYVGTIRDVSGCRRGELIVELSDTGSSYSSSSAPGHP